MTQLIDYIIAREEVKRDHTVLDKNEKLEQLEAAYREEKAIREAKEDAEIIEQINMMVGKKSYADFERDLLADFRKNHPHSSSPRRHVIGMMYDDYMAE